MSGFATVYLVIGDSAITRDSTGEIIETVDWADGRPDWTGAGICDHRGGGGQNGFGLLARALDAAEENAMACGFALDRVTP